MKFHKKYPRAQIHEEVEPSIIRFKHLEPCLHCGDMTEFYQIDFDAPFCSHECIKAKIKEMNKCQ